MAEAVELHGISAQEKDDAQLDSFSPLSVRLSGFSTLETDAERTAFEPLPVMFAGLSFVGKEIIPSKKKSSGFFYGAPFGVPEIAPNFGG